MSRALFALLVGLAFLFGAPYAASILYRIMGPWSVDATEADGSVTHMEFGTHLPRPAWVPVPPDGQTVQASRSTSATMPAGFNVLELTTHASLDDIKRFCTAQLAAAGFTVRDDGIGPLNPAAARYLGLDGTISGVRSETGDAITIQIRSPNGVLLPSRLLQIQWRKLPGWQSGHAAS